MWVRVFKKISVLRHSLLQSYKRLCLCNEKDWNCCWLWESRIAAMADEIKFFVLHILVQVSLLTFPFLVSREVCFHGKKTMWTGIPILLPHRFRNCFFEEVLDFGFLTEKVSWIHRIFKIWRLKKKKKIQIRLKFKGLDWFSQNLVSSITQY